MDAEQSRDVWSTVVASLDPLERRALSMIYLDGLTQSEIAERLCTRHAAITLAVARAMRAVAASVESRPAESTAIAHTRSGHADRTGDSENG